jgi:hypothetical protein
MQFTSLQMETSDMTYTKNEPKKITIKDKTVSRVRCVHT